MSHECTSNILKKFKHKMAIYSKPVVMILNKLSSYRLLHKPNVPKSNSIAVRSVYFTLLGYQDDHLFFCNLYVQRRNTSL